MKGFEDVNEVMRMIAANPDVTIEGLPVQTSSGKPLKPQTGILPSGNKYHAVRTYSELCQRTFDSKAEAQRGEGLALLEKAGEIEDLRYQAKFKLSDKPKITVTIDFAYLENGHRVFEDVKGVLTRDSRTKYAWLAEKYGVEVNLIK